MSITSPIVTAGLSSTKQLTRSRSLDRKLRVHMTHFAEDLGSEDLSNLCYVHRVPRGVRERNCNSGIDLIGYLQENGALDNEKEIIRMMRDLHKEEWARKTEHMIDQHLQSKLSSANSSTPVQETAISDECTVTAKPETVTVRHSQCSLEERKANSLKRQGLYLSQLTYPVEESRDVQEESSEKEELRRDGPGDDGIHDNMSKSNTNCYREHLQCLLTDVLQSPKVLDKFGEVLQEELMCRFSGGKLDTKSVENGCCCSNISQSHPEIFRSHSSVSNLSQRSSGYGSMYLETATNSLLISAHETMEGEQMVYQAQPEPTNENLKDSLISFSPPRRTSSTSLNSLSTSPTRNGLSRQSSCEDYFTADEEELTLACKCGVLPSDHSHISELMVGSDDRYSSGTTCSCSNEKFDSKHKFGNSLKQKIALCNDEEFDTERVNPMLRPRPGRWMKRKYPVTTTASIRSPPPKGRETLVGSMEIKRADLLKDLQRPSMKQRYTSYPFPFYSHAQQFQLLLYPSNLQSSAHCTLYLVMLKRRNSVIPQLRGKVCVYMGEVEDESEVKMPSSPLIEEPYYIDPQKLPATPAEAEFVSLALFPQLIPHSLLDTTHGSSIIIKAIIEQPVHLCH